MMAVASTSLQTNLKSNNAKTSKKNRIARPMNSFMVFAQEYRKELRQKNPSTDNKEISKMLGQKWKSLGPADKEKYSEQAKLLAEQHKKDHPDWKFVRAPPRKGKGKAAKLGGNSQSSPPRSTAKEDRARINDMKMALKKGSDNAKKALNNYNFPFDARAFSKDTFNQGGQLLQDSTTARLDRLDAEASLYNEGQIEVEQQRMQAPPPMYIAPPPIGVSPSPSPNMLFSQISNPSRSHTQNAFWAMQMKQPGYGWPMNINKQMVSTNGHQV